MIKLKSEVIETNIKTVSEVEDKEDVFAAAKEELKKVFKSNLTYKQYNDNLYVNRAWLGAEEKERLCLVLNDKVSIYIDENIEPVCGDIITGEWLGLDLEECKNILNNMFKLIINN